VATITLITKINAPIERTFDLTRSVDFHCESAKEAKETVVDGRKTGLLEKGDTVTWNSAHFGTRYSLGVKVTEFERPYRFRDVMVQGEFATFDHLRTFEWDEEKKQTILTDVLEYSTPYGALGRLAESLFLSTYLRKCIRERNNALKKVAESQSNDWQKYLPDALLQD